jgi:hypothetical protein
MRCCCCLTTRTCEESPVCAAGGGLCVVLAGGEVPLTSSDLAMKQAVAHLSQELHDLPISLRLNLLGAPPLSPLLSPHQSREVMERLPRPVVAIELLLGPIPGPPITIANSDYVLLVKN